MPNENRKLWFRGSLPSVSNANSDGGGARYIACAIARIFTSREPTYTDLMERFGMSRATAFRWIAAWRASGGKS